MILGLAVNGLSGVELPNNIHCALVVEEDVDPHAKLGGVGRHVPWHLAAKLQAEEHTQETTSPKEQKIEDTKVVRRELGE